MLDYDSLAQDFSLKNMVVNGGSEKWEINEHASYILNKPEFTFDQCCTPVAILYSCEECSKNGPCFTSSIREIDKKYRFVAGKGGWMIADTGISVWSCMKRSVILLTYDQVRIAKTNLAVGHCQRCTLRS